MRPLAKIILVPIAALAGCSQASGSVPDGASDLHCSVMAFHFNRQTEQSSAPAEQKRALAAVNHWYALKVRQLREKRGESDAVLTEAGPVLDALNRNPGGALNQFRACTDRALADPAFSTFVNGRR